MMQCVRRCSFICGAVLSLLLLLCSCQIGVGTGQFVQPPDIPPDDSSQGKTQLLSALNQEYFHRVQISNHFIQGSDFAGKLIDNRNLLVSSDSYQPYDCQRSGFAVGVIGGQALVVAVFVS